MPLNLADKNKIYIIQRIVGNKDMVHRLQSLGFVVGSNCLLYTSPSPRDVP